MVWESPLKRRKQLEVEKKNRKDRTQQLEEGKLKQSAKNPTREETVRTRTFRNCHEHPQPLYLRAGGKLVKNPRGYRDLIRWFKAIHQNSRLGTFIGGRQQYIDDYKRTMRKKRPDEDRTFCHKIGGLLASRHGPWLMKNTLHRRGWRGYSA